MNVFKHITVLLTCMVLFAVNAEEKTKPQMTFHASFDRFIADADVAKGEGKSTLQANLELRSTKGVSKSGLQLERGERCAYKALDNLNMEAATISMWVSPVNWNWQDKRYQYFFVRATRDPRFRIQLYVPGDKTGGGGIALYTCFGKQGKSDFKAFLCAAPLKWKQGEWHKIDASWDSETLRIYVDGQLKAKKDLPEVKFPPVRKGDKFYINRVWEGQKTVTHNPEDCSIMDEFKIYDGVLSNEQIMKNYMADRALMGGKVSKPKVLVPRIKQALKLDGKLDERMWKNASRIPIRVISNSLAIDKVAYASIFHSDKSLFVGFETSGKPKAKWTKHDGNIWEDDAFEMFIWPSEMGNEYRQIIVNANGAIFDSFGQDKSWNGTYNVKTNIGNDSWSVELEIPYTNFSNTPKNGDVWRANFCRDWYRKPPQRPLFTAWAVFMGSFNTGNGILEFTDRSCGVGLDLGNQLKAGIMNIDINNPGQDELICDWKVKSSHKPSKSGSFDVPAGEATSNNLTFKGFKDSNGEIRISDKKSKQLLMLYPVHFFVKEAVEAEFVPYINEKKLIICADIGNLEEQYLAKIKAGKLSLNVECTTPSGKHVKQQFTAKKVRDDYEMPFEWEDGIYQFKFTVSTAGLPAVSSTTELVKPPTPWLNTDAGKSDKVLKPWIPLKYAKNGSISMWNRTYKLNGPFPQKMINGGKDILADPVQLTMVTDKGRANFAVTNEKQLKKQDNIAEFAGTGAFEGLGGTAEFETFVEYDGLAATKLTLIPPKEGWQMKSLTMTIPIRKDIVKFIRKPSRVKWNGKEWKSTFEPYVWVCNEYEGFDWFFNSDANWNYTVKQQPTSIKVDGDKAVATLNIVMNPALVTKKLKYTFGFQATPVRPMMEKWRHVNNMTRPWWKGLNYNNWSPSYSKQFSVPEVAMPKEFAKYVKEKYLDRNMKLFLYMGACCTAAPNPTFDFFKKKWANPFGAGFYNITSRKSSFHPGTKEPYMLLPISQKSSHSDYMLWHARNALKQSGTPHIYTDMDRLHPDKNKYHGSGYTNDAFGRSGVTYDILDRRQFYKRLLTICREAGGLRWNHAHDALVLPYHAFNDFFYPGEQYSHNVYKNEWFYIKDLDPNAWRCELSGRASGINHVFLGQFVRGTQDKNDYNRPELGESLFALGLLNDVVISGSGNNREATEEYWALREKAGINAQETTSILYWEKDCPVKTVTEKSHASVYTTPKGIVIGVGNYAPTNQEVEINLDRKTLGLKTGILNVQDLRTGKSYQLNGDSIKVPLKSRNYTMLLIQQ